MLKKLLTNLQKSNFMEEDDEKYANRRKQSPKRIYKEQRIAVF